MATRKVDVRTFEDWLGQDITSSNLRRDPRACISFKNLERLENGSLRGRQGFKFTGQNLAIRSLHNYRYVDANGNPQEELICIGDINAGPTSNTDVRSMRGAIYRYKQGTLTLSRVATATPWQIKVVADCANDELVLEILEAGSEVYSFSLGTSFSASDPSLYELSQTISTDTSSTYTLTPPTTAVVNGLQSTVTTLTVDSGHNLSVGDIVQYQYNTSNTVERFLEVLATTSTSITFASSDTFADNSVIGHGRFPAAAALDIQITTSAAFAKSLNYSYWEPVFPVGSVNPASNLNQNYGEPTYRNISFVNGRNCVYFTSSYVSKKDLRKIVSDNAPEIEFKGGVWKYDGVTTYLSGPVNAADAATTSTIYTAVANASGGGPLAASSTYKYQISLLHSDARNNEIEGFLEYVKSITPGSTSEGVITISSTTVDPEYFNLRYADCSSTESSATDTFSVTAGHSLRTNDYVFFRDNSDELQKARVTAWTNTSITIDADHTIASGNVISTMRLRVYRTKADANEFFLAADDPVGSLAHVTTDTTTDANLGINLRSVKEEVIQYNFPRANTIHAHQSTIIAAGGPDIPNQIVWQDALYPESVDYARTNEKVPGLRSKDIYSLQTLSDQSLILNKGGSIYEASGSFSNNEIVIDKVNENRYGTESSDGCTPLDDFLMGISREGVWLTNQARQVSRGIGSYLQTLFSKNQFSSDERIEQRRCIIYFDSIKNWVHVFLPYEEEVTPDQFATKSTSRYFVFQVPEIDNLPILVSEFTFPAGEDPEVTQYFLPVAGFAEYDNNFYMGTRYWDSTVSAVGAIDRMAVRPWSGGLFKRLDNETSDETEDYHDHSGDYTWELIPQWFDNGEPEYDKAFYEFVLYQLQPDYYVDGFTVAFESYRDWKTDGTKTDTSRASSLVFSSSTQDNADLEFDRKYKAKRRTFKLSGTVCKNPPLFTGYSYTADTAKYRKDKHGRDT